MIVVSLVIILFLLHLRSALLPIVSIPLAVLASFIPLYLLGIPATIMSLGGIAIAIGATVDAEIVMVEAAHKKLEGTCRPISPRRARALLAEAAREVTPAIFFSLLIIAVSFIPVFGLTGQAGRLFRPLAFAKTFVMLSAAVLSVTVAPALRDYLIRGKIYSEARHPVSRVIRAFYEPFVHVALRKPKTTVLIGLMAVLSALPIASGGSGRSSCRRSTRATCSTCRRRSPRSPSRRRGGSSSARTPSCGFPRGRERVLGKAGRAETPTDPAPLSMFETSVKLKPRSAVAHPLRAALVRRPHAVFLAPMAQPAAARVRADDPRAAGPGDEPAAADARLDQRLHAADPQPRGHAHDRHPHPGRDQDLRQRPRRRSSAPGPPSSACCNRSLAPAACSSSARSGASTSTSSPTAGAGALRTSNRGRQRRDRERARRRAGDHHRRGAQPLHRQRALRRGLPNERSSASARCSCRSPDAGRRWRQEWAAQDGARGPGRPRRRQIELGALADVAWSRATDDPRRGGAAGGLRLRRHRREPRRGPLRRRRSERRGGGHAARRGARWRRGRTCAGRGSTSCSRRWRSG
jgi:hypothetical protein